MKPYILILAFGVFIALAFSPAHAAPQQNAYQRIRDKGAITCGYFTWAPYVIKDPNTGALSGINYEFMEEIGKILHLRIDWKEEVSAGTALEGLHTKRYDVMCATLWPDAARLEHALMSEAEFYSTLYIVVRQNDPRFDDNKTKVNSPDVTLAGIEGDVTFTVIKDHFPKAKVLALPQTSNGSELLENLVTRKADAVILDQGSVADFNRANPNSVRLAHARPPVAIFPETLAVRKGDTELMEALNTALAILKTNGFASRTIEKYSAYGYRLERYSKTQIK